jgi:hypothetical protein
VPELTTVDGAKVAVYVRTRFRLGDGIFSVKRVKLETVAARAGGTTPVVMCVFEGGIPPEFLKVAVGTEVPFPGDVVATMIAKGQRK